MIKLNLGCGNNVLDGWYNYDKYPVDSRVKKIELELLPLPFKDDSVDEILLDMVLEHLWVNQLSFMYEMYRILKDNGVVTVRLPINTNIVEHCKHRFNVYYFDCLLVNPFGSFFIRRQNRVRIFYLVSVVKEYHFQRHFLNKKNSGRTSEITGYHFDFIPFFRSFPHRVVDILFNGSITWVLKK